MQGLPRGCCLCAQGPAQEGGAHICPPSISVEAGSRKSHYCAKTCHSLGFQCFHCMNMQQLICYPTNEHLDHVHLEL